MSIHKFLNVITNCRNRLHTGYNYYISLIFLDKYTTQVYNISTVYIHCNVIFQRYDMYRYETHLHTSEGSACSNSTASEMARKYKDEGYTGIIVTDHFFNGNTCIDLSLPWEKKVHEYCKGYEHARETGAKIGLDVFFGVEYGNGASDFLVYGIDEKWLTENNDIMEMEPTVFLEYVRSCGAKVFQAHPFREAPYIRGTIHCPLFVDGIEIYNASHRDPRFNERAKIYAEWYGLPVTGGSDSHNTTDRFYPGGVLSPRKFTSALDYAEAVIAGGIEILTPPPPSAK